MNLPIVDYMNIADNGMVFYRLATQNDKGCVSYERGALIPGQDLSGLPLELIEQCQTVWTQEVISLYNSSIRLNP